MLRIFKKTTLFATALCASLGFFACSAPAQELAECPPGAAAGSARQGLLHHQGLNCRPQTWGSP